MTAHIKRKNVRTSRGDVMQHKNKLDTMRGKIIAFDKMINENEVQVAANLRFVIAIPSVKEEGEGGYDEAQFNDALFLANHIKEKAGVGHVEIVKDCFTIPLLASPSLPQIDYIIFLFEFWEKERDYILDSIFHTSTRSFSSVELHGKNEHFAHHF